MIVKMSIIESIIMATSSLVHVGSKKVGGLPRSVYTQALVLLQKIWSLTDGRIRDSSGPLNA